MSDDHSVVSDSEKTQAALGGRSWAEWQRDVLGVPIVDAIRVSVMHPAEYPDSTITVWLENETGVYIEVSYEHGRSRKISHTFELDSSTGARDLARVLARAAGTGLADEYGLADDEATS